MNNFHNIEDSSEYWRVEHSELDIIFSPFWFICVSESFQSLDTLSCQRYLRGRLVPKDLLFVKINGRCGPFNYNMHSIMLQILCIDEATANVDQETDRQIQLILRSAFRKSTVITIAHRVQTVLDCDRIMVMGDGQLLEFDTPENLLDNPDSHFYQLSNQE